MNKLVIILATILCTTTAMAADDCSLKQLASFNITPPPSGEIVIPVKISGTELEFGVSFGAIHSAVTADAVSSLKPQTQALPRNTYYHFSGQEVTETVQLPDIQIGMMDITKPQMLLLPKALTDSGLAGYLGMEELSLMDIELDLGHNKINFFSPDHCKGQVVYWANSAAALKLDLDSMGSITARTSLDGQELRTSFSPTLQHGRMYLVTLKELFLKGPRDLESIGTIDGHAAYRYPFKALSADGLTINNPNIDIVDTGATRRCDAKLHFTQDERAFKCFGGSDLSLGMSELRALRFYFAFKEKMLYVTGADAHK